MSVKFAASQLYPVLKKINEMWGDPRTARDLEQPIETARAIMENQLITLDPVLVGKSCRAFEVTWLKRCGIDAIDCADEEYDDTSADDCTITGEELESAKAEYDAAGCLTDSFMVWDDDCKGLHSFEEKVARGLIECMKNIRKAVNLAAVSFLSANVQTNNYTGGLGVVDGDLTYFDPSLWNVDLIGEFQLNANLNKIRQPVFVSGTNLWNVFFNAMYNKSNDDQRDQGFKMDHFKRWYFDAETVDPTLGQPSTLMFDRGSVGFFSKNEFENNAPFNNNDKNNTFTYSMPDPSMTFMDDGTPKQARYDVITQVVCKTTKNGIPKFGRVFKLIFRYAYILSPEDCAGDTGLLHFVKGTAPVEG